MENTLNGKILKDLFGAVISGGSGSLLAYPKRKESLSTDWPEEEGIDIDLSAPTFEAREFTLNMALLAESLADFKSKYNGLFTELRGQDTHELYIADHDTTYILYYKSQSNFKKLVNSFNNGKVGVTFDLVFGETNPDDNISAVYLVEDQDRYLTA